MQLQTTPKGLFRVREPLDELLDCSGRHLAASTPADALESTSPSSPWRKAVRAAEALARRRLLSTAAANGAASTATATESEEP